MINYIIYHFVLRHLPIAQLGTLLPWQLQVSLRKSTVRLFQSGHDSWLGAPSFVRIQARNSIIIPVVSI